MKAIVIYEAGGTEKLIYTEVSTPKVKEGWSLVKVKGFGINHSEIFTRQGLSPSVKFPRILGIECVGLIEESTDAQRLPVGAKVISIMGEMGRAFDGGYAEYALLPNEQIYPVETNLSWEELAVVPETYYTAYGSILNLRINENDSILVRGATSGVGAACAKLLRAKYPQMIIDGSSRSDKKSEALQQVGFSDVIIDRGGKLQTDKKYDKILELIGPATIKDSFKHLNARGIICSTGQLGGKWYLEEFDPIIDLAEDSYLTSFYSGNVKVERLNAMFKFIEDNRVDVNPDKIFKLDEVSKAHAYLESSKSFGKIIVII